MGPLPRKSTLAHTLYGLHLDQACAASQAFLGRRPIAGRLPRGGEDHRGAVSAGLRMGQMVDSTPVAGRGPGRGC